MTVETPAGTDRAAIEETIEHYFAAVSHNDPEALRLAFHPDCVMQSVQEGALVSVTQPAWQQRLAGAASPLPAKRRIESLQIDGTLAAVKARATFATFEFIDRLLLLKIGGRWQIVAKAFHREERSL
jgi:hypothetical protein